MLPALKSIQVIVVTLNISCLFDIRGFEKQGKDTMICLSEGFLCLVLSS